MTRWLRHTVSFNRLVLLAGSLLFATIARSYLFHPVASGAPFGITFGSADAITIARVGFGGFPLALAVILIACQLSGRLLVGLRVLATVAVIITAVRIAGLLVDGPGPFTVHVLRPEIALSVLSIVAATLEARRRKLPPNAAPEARAPSRTVRRTSEQS
jgi:hypothetical protein